MRTQPWIVSGLLALVVAIGAGASPASANGEQSKGARRSPTRPVRSGANAKKKPNNNLRAKKDTSRASVEEVPSVDDGPDIDLGDPPNVDDGPDIDLGGAGGTPDRWATPGGGEKGQDEMGQIMTNARIRRVGQDAHNLRMALEPLTAAGKPVSDAVRRLLWTAYRLRRP